MSWEVDGKSAKRLADIAAALKSDDRLILATDPDREGEAISWHVLEVLKKKGALKGKDVKRVVFNAITKQSVLEAMQHPRDVDADAGRCLSGPPRARLSRRLLAVARVVAQAAGLALGRPRAVGGAAPDLRPRTRDRDLPAPRNTGRIDATFATAAGSANSRPASTPSTARNWASWTSATRPRPAPSNRR